MISVRKMYVPISLLSFSSVPCMVVYNSRKGTEDRWNPYTWDEPVEYDSIEIVDVFTLEDPNKSVIDFMTLEEENYLQDLVQAYLEDEKCC